MREIKFRGKNKNNMGKFKTGDWLYGGIEFDNDRYWIDTPYYGEIIVDKDTIGQYTGLKDKNGKEIYEGDIVEITRPCVYETGKIIFKNGCFFIKVELTLLALYECEINNYTLEVIGNIYDNPELLEV